MPSNSPGLAPTTAFTQILPGAPSSTLQALTTLIHRDKRYIVYSSGCQLNILSLPTTLVQALAFDDDIVAVSAELLTGKLAVASESEVWVLQPVTEGWTKVWWEKTLLLLRGDAEDEPRSLSWGDDGEVMVGGSRQVSLFSTLPSSRTSSPAASPIDGHMSEQRRSLWSKSVASPTQYASFSPSATLIATCGGHDRLVKIWRRLSFEEGLFDYTYLPHPGAVTHLEWRPRDEHIDEEEEGGLSGRYEEEHEVLYTVANDGVLRIWKTGGIHDLDILALHTSVDLVSAIPQLPSLALRNGPNPSFAQRPTRYVLPLSSNRFCGAVHAALALQTGKISHSLEHLQDVASKEPEVVVALDGYGRMSAWGLQSVGHKRRPDTPSETSLPAFHIAHAEGLSLRIAEGANARFEAWFDGSQLNLIVHSLDGYIQWWCGSVELFFSPSTSGSERLQEAAFWSGQHRQITALRGSPNSRALVSRSVNGELAHWSPNACAHLRCTAACTPTGTVIDFRLVLLDDGTALGTLILSQARSKPHKLSISLYDPTGTPLETTSFEMESYDAIETLQIHLGPQRCFVLSPNGNGRIFTIDVSKSAKSVFNGQKKYVLPSTPQEDCLQHSVAIIDDDCEDKAGLVCISKSGMLLLYHLQTAEEDGMEASAVATFESGVPSASVFAASNESAAVVSSDGRQLSIINLRDGYLEYQRSQSERTRHVAFNSKHNLVAVGYATTIDVLAQGRYEHHSATPAWITVKQLAVTIHGLSANALAWLGDGGLAVGAGNGILLSGNRVNTAALHPDIEDVTDVDAKAESETPILTLPYQLQYPLPVWHPSLISHLVRHERWQLASSLVSKLLQKLRFWSEGDQLHSLLNVPAEQLYGAQHILEEPDLDEDTVTELVKQLEEKRLPQISLMEQTRFKRVLQAMFYCSEHVQGLDNGALRFLFNWKLELLRLEAQQPNGVQPNGVTHEAQTVPQMHWREIAFAYHSTTQQPLLDILTEYYENKITWNVARRLGLFAWLTDREALCQLFEALAQSAYRASSPPDPTNGSLYFLALHKKPTLLALWRIATWHREQRTTMNFLRRDFTQAENKTAAKKNAYALMGKKRSEYAAAFFLLADDAASATSVLASQCQDSMLAIAVARLYSGDGSAVLRKLVEDRLMPIAKQDGDRCLMSWCHSIVLEKDDAADSLIRPLNGVRFWQQDDPSSIALYNQLRGRASEYEYDGILRAARILRRMGLWLPALELVRCWKFKPVEGRGITSDSPIDGTHSLPSILNGNTESKDEFQPSESDPPQAVIPTPVEDEKVAREAKAAELLKKMKAKKTVSPLNEKQPEPTQFKEPDASSLLDNFGF